MTKTTLSIFGNKILDFRSDPSETAERIQEIEAGKGSYIGFSDGTLVMAFYEETELVFSVIIKGIGLSSSDKKRIVVENAAWVIWSRFVGLKNAR